jgi:cytochrome c553
LENTPAATHLPFPFPVTLDGSMCALLDNPRVRASALFTMAIVAWCSGSTSIADEPIHFNRDIRPILSENCFYCHGQDGNKRMADLRLDQRDAAITAGAIVPEGPAGSEMIVRINSTDPGTLMPPPKSNRRLSAEQKALLEKWIASGAQYEPHWAFVAPTRPTPPAVPQTGWVRTPIDQFVLAKLEAIGLAPNPEANRETLIKRLSIDLTGLPPKPEEVAAFVNDPDPQAYEKLVDRLLASPHYGERMALPWLDAARYADSNGFQQDGDTWQWYWRDWVVRALNDDLPFDQFTVWQLAGDLLPDATIDQKIASGFNRNHLLNGEGGAIPEEQRFNNLFDRVDTTSTTWLGLTMACAQCHDHKYDPMTQRDYYRLLDAFNRVPEIGVPSYYSSRIRVAPPILELPDEQYKAKVAEFEKQIAEIAPEERTVVNAAFEGWKSAVTAAAPPSVGGPLPDAVLNILKKPEGERSEDEKKQLESGLRDHFNSKVRGTLGGRLPAIARIDSLRQQLDGYTRDNLPRIMIMSDAQPRETAILDRGEYLSPMEKVSFQPPEFLPPLPEGAPTNRLGLAQWLVAPENPLTSRVAVNRAWQHFFGAGIVKTAEDFGVQSEHPVHGELLDWLAVEFREQDWSQKKLHRLIVTSSVYRQSSRVTPDHRAKDPENKLFGRSARGRMPSLLLRDWALAASGLIDLRIGGKPVYPYQPDGVWEALAMVTMERDFTYPASSGSDLYRRSLYTFWRRTVSPTNMFDSADRQTCRVRVDTTSTPLHALTTLNDPTWVEASRALAEFAMKSEAELDARLTFAFRRVLCRNPNADDMQRLQVAYHRQLGIYQADLESARQLLAVGESKPDGSLPTAEHAALTAVCLAIFNCDEALSRE